MREFSCKQVGEVKEVAKALLPDILLLKNVCFVAQMGAGKTTLIKEICIALGVEEAEIHSPTYSLVNEYQGNGVTIFHFDFYRLKNLEEAFDFGLEEYFTKNALCLMEWPEIVAPLLPMPSLKITITVEDEIRKIKTEIINFL